MSDDDEPPLDNSNMDNDSAFEKDDNIEDDSGIDNDLNDNGGDGVCFQCFFSDNMLKVSPVKRDSKRKCVEGAGRKLAFADLEDMLFQWIAEQRVFVQRFLLARANLLIVNGRPEFI
uniref:Uncharacterized protein n=1 Tax=Romanomermis culicivorax TaxID=13658 RepID=A0A915KSB6_ROMCU